MNKVSIHVTILTSEGLLHSLEAKHCKVIVSEHQLSARGSVHSIAFSLTLTLVHCSQQLIHCPAVVPGLTVERTPGEENERILNLNHDP